MPQETLIARRVADAVDAVMGYWDHDLRCQFANAAYETWFGIPAREMLGVSIGRFLGTSYETILPYILGALEGEAQVFEREIRLPGGMVRHGLVSYHPDVTDGLVRGFSEHVVNITRAKRLEYELEKCQKRAGLLATHDFLTGLPNRFLLADRISALLSYAEKSGELVGIIAMDIDGFKRLNETYGGEEGDGVLREIARRLKSSIQPTETIIRTGGDEFLLLAKGLQAPTAVNLIVSRILSDVQQPLQYGRASLTPSLSFGTAIFPLNGTTASELLAYADKALEQAKRFASRRPSST
jgi:diguanylate cyclase (GGDEF)-like protein/PAS domain S-box-containing protein